MRLAVLLAAAGVVPDGPPGADPVVLRVTHDSRTVAPGDLFCCVPGGVHDGHRFAADAVSRGAVAVLAERPLAGSELLDVPVMVVPSVRVSMGPLAAAARGWPSRDLDLAGVTGTNGKTSVVHLLRSVLTSAGRQADSWGTLSGARTTPEGPDLQATLAGWVTDGVEAAAIEVSSHALAQHRVDGTTFTAIGFTTLGRDHLDFHGSMAAYEAAKARLFDGSFSDHAVVAVDGPAGARMAALAESTGLSVVRVYPAVPEATVSADGCTLRWRGRTVRLATGGRFTVANALVAAELAVVLGCGEADVVAGLADAPPVPGRFQPVLLDGGPTVLVDYAHTPDALAAVLAAAREVLEGERTGRSTLGGLALSAGSTPSAGSASGRLIVVFGCGGERDLGKRPLMGRAAEGAADLAIVTSDNPRGEPPAGVIADILAGMERSDPLVEPDRRRAISAALVAAGPGDLVVVAGRGHEATQEVAGRYVPFDDRTVVVEEWRRLRDGADRPDGGGDR